MCGIAGVIGRDAGEMAPMVNRMVEAQSHRGPDATGTTRPHAQCVLGSSRLAVLDLSDAAVMPMRDDVTGNVLVFNGEIYNHAELRRRLEARGVKFRTTGDTEVLLKAYGQLGTSVFEELDGMFAFALWDDRSRELLLARDPLGEKPLYVTETARGLVFASEVRALLASGAVERRLDPLGVRSFLTNGFVVSPRTVVAGISSVLPGTWIRLGLHDGQVTSQRYWSIPAAEQDVPLPESEDAFREAVTQAILTRLRSDVPLAAFLSGGIDSALIAGVAQSAGRQISTFSLTFPGTDVDEGQRIAELVAAKEFDNTLLEVKAEDFFDLAARSLTALDQPSLDGANTFMVSHYARKAGFKVAVSGLGADELFGGYPFFRQAMHLARLHRLLSRSGMAGGFNRAARAVASSTSSRGLTKLQDLDVPAGKPGLAELVSYQVTQRLFPRAALDALMDGTCGQHDLVDGLPSAFVDALRPELEGQDAWGRLSAVAVRVFLGERALRDADGASMASSLELRTPFTARGLVETAFRMSGETRLSDAPFKRIEASIAKEYLPADWLERNTKKGFLLPFDQWLRSPDGSKLLDDTLLDRRAVESVGLAPAAVAGLVGRFKRGDRGSSWSRIWPLLSLLHWSDRHKVSIG